MKIVLSDDQRIALLRARIARAEIEKEGIIATNEHRVNCGLGIAYDESSFDDIVVRNKLDEESVIKLLLKGEM